MALKSNVRVGSVVKFRKGAFPLGLSPVTYEAEVTALRQSGGVDILITKVDGVKPVYIWNTFLTKSELEDASIVLVE